MADPLTKQGFQICELYKSFKTAIRSYVFNRVLYQISQESFAVELKGLLAIKQLLGAFIIHKFLRSNSRDQKAMKFSTDESQKLEKFVYTHPRCVLEHQYLKSSTPNLGTC